MAHAVFTLLLDDQERLHQLFDAVKYFFLRLSRRLNELLRRHRSSHHRCQVQELTTRTSDASQAHLDHR
ncbi:hypothetical protein HY009_09785, partial [Candidatus Acetothermia bacterium]|nr:hypothetical protein [Candidatus Acetothermia bacterium]